MQYVRDNENYAGDYARSANFEAIIRSEAPDADALYEVIEKIPNFYLDFHHVIIE